MSLIADTEHLQQFCARLQHEPFITVDTEFMRERTYWPQLCVVQVAGEEDAAVIDALAPDIDLTPLYTLLHNPNILKVFHAGRQDLEIIVMATGKVPLPLFDTQVAAALLGFGEQAGFESLATKLAGAKLDKGSRFTDWARRPLSERQVAYALADVTVLRPVYQKLTKFLEKRGRRGWMDDEQKTLLDPATYDPDPEQVWRRLKSRSREPRVLCVLQAVAAWREREAQRVNIPRSRILRDDAVMEVAHHPPRSIPDLIAMRGISQGFAEGKMGKSLLAALEAALARPQNAWPQPEDRPDLPPGLAPVIDLLRVLLKQVADEHEIATSLIASSDDLERLAAADGDDPSLKPLSGWRREIFGLPALELKAGKLALGLKGRRLEVIAR